MLSTLFSNQNVYHLLELFFWLLGAFLIGLFFGRLIGSKKTNNTSAVFQNNIEGESLDLTHDISKIRAKKTFERGGLETVKTVIISDENSELNFDRIGRASLETKDDLGKIKGIGPAIEEKLNGIGIFTFKQITHVTDKDIAKITDLIEFPSGRIERDKWIEQATALTTKN